MLKVFPVGATADIPGSTFPKIRSVSVDRWRGAITPSLTSVCALLLQGCASLYSEMTDFANGWRSATVVEIGSAANIQRKMPLDCRATLTVADAASSRFAVFVYHSGREHRYWTAPLPMRSELKIGELVWVNVRDCTAPVRPRPTSWRDAASHTAR